MLWHVSVLHCFFWLNNIPWVYIHQLMDMYIISNYYECCCYDHRCFIAFYDWITFHGYIFISWWTCTLFQLLWMLLLRSFMYKFCVSVCECIFSFLMGECAPRHGMTESYGDSVFTFWRNCQTVSAVAAPFYTSACEDSSFSILLSTFIVLHLKEHIVPMKWYSLWFDLRFPGE